MAQFRVTVCQLPDQPAAFAKQSEKLLEHTRRERTDVLLLPEMPAFPWLAHRPKFEQTRWDAAVEAHDRFVEALGPFAPASVLSARPITAGKRRYDQAFVWSKKEGYRAAHEKAFLPNEPGFYEARWFEANSLTFKPIDVSGLSVGFQICTEVMFNEWSRRYGKQGVHLIACPRTSGNADRWEIALRMAAVASGSYAASSNRCLPRGEPSVATFGGEGWIVGPEGEVLAKTSNSRPFATAAIDTAKAEKAKKSYPRYIKAA